MSNKKKKLPKGTVALISIFALIIVLLSVFTILLFNVVDFDTEETKLPGAEETLDNHIEDETGVEVLNELRDAGSLSSILKEWALSGDEGSYMKSRDVYNFLLIGCDASGSNSDVIMLTTVNTKDKKIHLTSMFRDSYTYIPTSSGKMFAKINASYATGGASKLIETVQNDYKIKIDYYVSVNFQSFVDVVNILGGITLDVKQYEAQAVGPDCPYGEGVTLTGEQALMFCRIRKCDADGDVSRTRRQREFITALINKSRELGISQIGPIVNSLLKYVKTDCDSTDIIALATQAVIGKWYGYTLESSSIPMPEHRMDYNGNAWVWIVDYPAAAKALQESIYGESNIVLSENRVTAIDIMKEGSTGDAHP